MNNAIIAIFIACVIAVLLGVGALVGAAVLDKPDALRAATNAGLRDVRVTGTHILFAPFAGCSDKDEAAVDVSGINQNGRRITVTVCQGILKKSTVRY
jgi:hypothetical protein